MNFKCILTDQGNATVLTTLVKGGNIKFTKVEIGSGKNENPQQSITLAQKKLNGQLLDVGSNSDDSATINFFFDNKGIEEGFNFTEFGIFAKYENQTDDFLYAYGYSIDDIGEVIPKFADANSYVKENIFVTLKIGSPDEININLGEYEDYASKKAFEEHLKSENPHGVTWGQVFNKSATPLPVEQGGTGVTSLEQLKNKLEDTMLDYKSSVKFSSDIFNVYCDAFWRQNNIAFIFMTFQIKKALGQDNSCLICKLPTALIPTRTIAVQGQTNEQGSNPSVTIQFNTDGKVMLYSFGYENLPINSFCRFQAVYPVLPARTYTVDGGDDMID